MTADDELARGYVSGLWAEDWDCPEDEVWDEAFSRATERAMSRIEDESR